MIIRAHPTGTIFQRLNNIFQQGTEGIEKKDLIQSRYYMFLTGKAATLHLFRMDKSNQPGMRLEYKHLQQENQTL